MMVLGQGSETFHHLFSMIFLGIIFLWILVPQSLHYFHQFSVSFLVLDVEIPLESEEFLAGEDPQRDWQIQYPKLVLDEEAFVHLEDG